MHGATVGERKATVLPKTGTCLRDTTPDFAHFWDAAHGAPPDVQAAAWAKYEQRHADLFAASGGRLGGVDYLSAAMPRYARDRARMAQIRAQLPALITDAADRLGALFGLDALPVRWVLAVGTYWSDGWVCELDGQPTVVIALEMLDSLRHAHLLVAHEVAHLAHAQAAGPTWDGLVTLADGLFLEGLAVCASAHLVPHQTASTYLWAGISATPTGESLDAWLGRCEAAWPEIRQRVHRDLERTDQETITTWFLGDKAGADMPMRAGYAAGYWLVSRLARDVPIAELARWDSQRINRAIARLLAEEERRGHQPPTSHVAVPAPAPGPHRAVPSPRTSASQVSPGIHSLAITCSLPEIVPDQCTNLGSRAAL